MSQGGGPWHHQMNQAFGRERLRKEAYLRSQSYCNANVLEDFSVAMGTGHKGQPASVPPWALSAVTTQGVLPATGGGLHPLLSPNSASEFYPASEYSRSFRSLRDVPLQLRAPTSHGKGRDRLAHRRSPSGRLREANLHDAAYGPGSHNWSGAGRIIPATFRDTLPMSKQGSATIEDSKHRCKEVTKPIERFAHLQVDSVSKERRDFRPKHTETVNMPPHPYNFNHVPSTSITRAVRHTNLHRAAGVSFRESASWR
mmetsp:Transcript_46759/g.89302  ORF Transcript_46759/g.89302 Transcript_46759/m.89302 type:complete len:256 (+) Transcript_46759:211-978(+)